MPEITKDFITSTVGGRSELVPQFEKQDGSMVMAGEKNPQPVQLLGSDIQVPVDIQSRYAQTIQTHAGTMVAPVSSSIPTTWIDCNGFDSISVTLLNDAATTTVGNIQWSHDGVNRHGDDSIFAPASTQRRTATTTIKARYAKLHLDNNDAAPHTFSAWVYLRA